MRRGGGGEGRSEGEGEGGGIGWMGLVALVMLLEYPI